MSERKILSKAFYELISALILILSVIPGYNNIGKLFLQITMTFVIVIAFLIVADRKRFSPVTLSHSLVIMSVFWVGTALYKQIMLHIETGDKSFSWLYLFYFDRPALIVVVFLAVITFYVIKYIINFNDKSFVYQYKKFLKTTAVSFGIFYIIVLVYCFVLVRSATYVSNPINFIPFNVFKVMKAGNYEYEFIFLFWGNIAIFMPLGSLMSIILKDRHKLLLAVVPFAVSVGIEICQYFTGNGWADIDDVILNVIGFYLGVAVKVLFDRLIRSISKGKISSVFTF